MEDDLTTPDDSAESDFNIIEVEDDKEAVKEFVSKHLKDLESQSPGLLYSDTDEAPFEETVSPNKTSRKASKKSPCKIQQGAVFSGKILSFGCSECKDDATYSPNDLLKHFQGAHKGNLPTYPCDLCGFVTNEFPALQRHRIGHRNTLVTCEICNDNVQYSLLLLTRHFIMCHSLNGHFHCEKCEFSTTDAGTFVQHIHHHNESRIKCVKCQHVSSSRSEHQKHQKVHSGTFPFSCQLCGYGAARREYLNKHMVTFHGMEAEKKNVWRAIEDSNNTLTSSSAGLKLLLKKSPSAGGASKDSQWMSKLHSLPGGGLLDQNGRMFSSEKNLEETQSFLEKTVGSKKDSKKCNKGKNDQSPSKAMSSPSPSKDSDNSFGADTGSPNSNGLTVLMVKNKISLPPNCTTKVMGFKMVDGKKHLVLKVIPAVKLDCSPQNAMSLVDQEMGYSTSDITSDGSKHSRICPSARYLAVSQRSGSPFSPDSGQTSTPGTDQDTAIITEVKVEEEETSIGEMSSRSEEEENGEDKLNLSQRLDGKHTPNNEHASQKATKESDSLLFENSQLKNSKSPNFTKTQPLLLSTASSDVGSRAQILVSEASSSGTFITEDMPDTALSAVSVPAANIPADVSLDAEIATQQLQFRGEMDGPSEDGALRTTTYCNESIIHDPTVPDGISGESKPSIDRLKRKSSNSKVGSTPGKDTLENTDSIVKEKDPPVDASRKTNAENSIENHQNQEVFSFHNYSKETSSLSSSSTQPFESLSEHSAEEGSYCRRESPEWSLTLAASPMMEHGIEDQSETGNGEETLKDINAIERVSESDIEVEECIATVEDPGSPMPNEKENRVLVHQGQPKVKLEEESVPLSEKPTGSKSTSAALGRIVEEHSDAIISHQLEKERVGFSATGPESVRPPKTTLRILQTPEGKQQMFLQTADNRYPVPVQLKGNSGFKLITKSSTPQINVSYVKPGIERQSNPSGIALTLNSGRIGMSSASSGASEKGPKLISAVQPGAGTSASRYLVNSAALKSPLLLSGTAQGAASENMVKGQSTCYLVQRPLPIAQVLSNAGSKLTNANSSLSSRPVLAMPVNSRDKLNTLQTGRQAFLVRYISPAKPGSAIPNQSNESRGNKVLLKIVRTANGIISGGPPASANQSLFLATGSSQTPCFLVSNKCNANLPTGVKKFIPLKNSAQRPVAPSRLSSLQANVGSRTRQPEGVDLQRAHMAPRPIRPPSQRKRRRKALFDELPEPVPKSRRLTSKALPEKEDSSLWVPVPKDAERTLRLSPFNSLQQFKCPRRNQPVVVLNHPDADIPEVAAIMRLVNRYKGAVSKVALSRKTVQALLDLGPVGGNRTADKCHSSKVSSPKSRMILSSARERFILKMNLKKMTKKKYEVVKSSSVAKRPSKFSCWFCGRLFDNQEDWIGHGQRHLMEATRDWNKLF
ncbi:zinc finger protein 518A [Osmerus eperlanus]|uniref:zinc finger protein 518A n=1 Tax=Osmerus eperlanus TaxID=29151 RepID=UPI002E13A4D4